MEEKNTPKPPKTVTEVTVSPHQGGARAQKSGFTPISQLFKDSWTLFTKKFLKFLVLGGYTLVAVFAVIFVCSIIFLMFGGVNAISTFGKEGAGNILPFILIGIVYIVTVAIISVAGRIAGILIISQENEVESVMSIFKRSFPLVLPLFLVGLIDGFLVFGAAMLFIVPGVIVGIFLSFFSYVVIIDKKRGISALKMSAGIIQQSFGEIFSRILLLILGYFGILIVLSIFSSFSDTVAALVSLIQLILQLGAGAYASAYLYLIYKQARASFDESKPVSITWMWIVSGSGWVIGIFLYMIVSGLVAGQGTEFMNSVLKELNKVKPSNGQMMYDQSPDVDYDQSSDSSMMFEK